MKQDKYGHVTRFSDSSFYDEVCIKCGATDSWSYSGSALERLCPEVLKKKRINNKSKSTSQKLIKWLET